MIFNTKTVSFFILNILSILWVFTARAQTKTSPLPLKAYDGANPAAVYEAPQELQNIDFGKGLNAYFYEGTDFDKLIGGFVTNQLNYDWSDKAPLRALRSTNYTARFEGWLYVPKTGIYTFYFYVDDGVKFELGDMTLIKEWKGQYPQEYFRRYKLEGGRFYKVNIEYLQMSHTAYLQFSWRFENEEKKLVDKDFLVNDLRHVLDLLPEKDATLASQAATSRALSSNRSSSKNALIQKSAAKQPAPVRTDKQRQKGKKSIERPQPDVREAGRNPQPAETGQKQKAKPAKKKSANLSLTARAENLKVADKLLLDAVYFSRGKAKLDISSLPQLRELVALMKKYPGLKILVVGHTDNVGNAQKNLRLSLKRAESVCTFLQSEGIGEERLQFKGVGGADPVTDNYTEESRKQNRRVEFVVQEI